MAQNKIRGAPNKKATNRIRDQDVISKVNEQANNYINIGLKYLSRNKKKLIPYALLTYVGDQMSYLYRMSEAMDAIDKGIDVINSIEKIITSPIPSFYAGDILVGLATACIVKTILYVRSLDKKNYRKGEEYGSASFGTLKDIEPFIDWDNPDNNLLLSLTEKLSMEPRMKDPSTNRNKNVLVIGGSGSGKTRGYVKPNLMQLNASYLVTDPKGTVLNEVGTLLKKAGYKIIVLNTTDFDKSMHYNPFAYIKNEKDIMKVVDAFMSGTETSKQQGEQFWTDSMVLLLNALIGYIMKVGLEEEKNFLTLLDLINAMEIREDDDSFKNAIDFMFEELEAEDPECYAVLQYKKFKQAAGKTARSIMISIGSRLARFDIPAVRDIMRYDEMELDKLGDEKTALFIIISDTSKTMNFMATMLYTQVFNLLCEKADNEYGGSLPVPVHCILDEFANIGKIPDLEILISTIRSRAISVSIILQSLAQLNNLYDKAADIISDNCDTMLYLGGKGKTLKDISDLLGKETIDLYNTSDTRGSNRSYGTNYSKAGRELLTQDELAKMPGNKCIVQIRGVKPFYSIKYDITSHKRYKYLSDYDKKNLFDVGKYVRREATISNNEVCEVIVVD